MPNRRLLLVRHAKAEHGDRDLERPLARRGRADAAAIGDWMLEMSTVPDLALVSPAARTVETWEIASGQLRAPVPHRLDDRLYDNRVRGLLELISEVAARVMTLAVIGHNPSIHELALLLGGDDVGAGFPTAAVAHFDVMGDWSELSSETVTLVGIKACRA